MCTSLSIPRVPLPSRFAVETVIGSRVRIIDLVMALSTLAGLASVFRTGKIIGRTIWRRLLIEYAPHSRRMVEDGRVRRLWLRRRNLIHARDRRGRRERRGNRSRCRPSTVMLLVCLLIGIQGCAGFAPIESRSAVNRQSLTDLPVTIRTLDSDHQFLELPAASVAERLRAMHARETLNILALSGGGSAGAFGAGAVAGLTRSGSRPDFAVVTGVSAGALIAPYAFLGSAWDARLFDAFTSGASQNLLQSRGLGVIFSSSLYSGAPLKEMVDTYVSDTMIQAVAREASKGRLLLIATTDVASGDPVVWDLGAIARNGGSSARTLFRDVLVASASVPGMFPPVIIRVPGNGATHDEAHVDGSVTLPFFVPPAFAQTPPDVLDATQRTAIYIIVDRPLGEPAQTTRLTAHAILSRSIHAGLNHMLLTTLELTAATAQLQGATLQYSAVPDAYPLLDAYDFRVEMMRPLFRYAYECAEAGRLWTAFQRTDDDRGTVRSAAETQKIPCPADDAIIKYFASR
jgi:predicted acylesterase/phospholipase RssA